MSVRAYDDPRERESDRGEPPVGRVTGHGRREGANDTVAGVRSAVVGRVSAGDSLDL